LVGHGEFPLVTGGPAGITVMPGPWTALWYFRFYTRRRLVAFHFPSHAHDCLVIEGILVRLGCRS
jgi:hypothetical protein